MYTDEYGNVHGDTGGGMLQQSMRDQQAAFLADIKKQYQSQMQGATFATDDGLRKIEGGQNMYGMDKADTMLMRDDDGNLAERFRETEGDSLGAIKEYGNTLGEDIDPRLMVGMGDSFNALKDKAMSEGDSTWASQQRVKQLGDIDSSSSQSVQNNLANMAMKGGAGGGSAERMLANAGNSAMMQKQSANAGISAQDESMKNQLLSQVGGVEQNINAGNAAAFGNDINRKLGALQTGAQVEQDINKSNTATLRGDLDRQNMAAAANYKQDVSAWGAKQSADGQRAASSGGGGGGMSVICTAFNKRGLLNEEDYEASTKFGLDLLEKDHKNGTHSFASYMFFMSKFVKLMDKNRLVDKIAQIVFKPFVKHTAGKKNLLGFLTLKTGELITTTLYPFTDEYKVKKLKQLRRKQARN